ncbi:MAG: ABC transporter permease, partial [Lachnospiraceae bacterium]|nr:ABC transporter permease [Lachnospiraceae bacterium]
TMLSQVIRLILKQEGIIGGGGLSDLPAGFHVLPLLVVILEFLFDLYFIMDENVKMVTRMSPVSAIRGEYRYKLPKIKMRDKNLFRRLSLKIFGLDGDYAFKNIMRHPGRFYRTIGAMIFGIAAFMGVGAAVHSMIARVQQQFEDAGYYQIYVYNEYGRDETIEQVESSLPPVENLTALSELNDITEAKRMYVAETYLPSPEPLVEHYSEDYLASDLGKRMKGIWDRMKSGEAPYRPDMFRNVLCYGYSAEDLARYQPVLTDGTLDVSPQGIILVNWAWTYDENPYSHTAGDEFDDYGVEYTDYQVGDTIELADVGELHKLLDEPLNELRMEKYELLTELSQDQNYNEEHSLSEFEGDYGNAETPQLAKAHMIDDEYKEKETELIADCERQLKENGYYRTYTIEGIVSRDVNTEVDTQIGGSALRIIMPLEYYYTFTGTDESQPTGMMYHTDRLMPNMNQIWNALSMIEFDDSLYVSFDMGDGGSQIFSIMDTYTSTSGTYIGVVSEMSVILKWLLGGVAVVGFILLMFGLNMLNTTASNLYLRRSELAQLRVIGVSKKHLMRMVLLEGVIEVLIADVIGILIGGALSYGVFFILRILYQTKYYFPFFIAAVCIVLSVLVVCGAIYFPLRRMTNDLADDLKLGAE